MQQETKKESNLIQTKKKRLHSRHSISFYKDSYFFSVCIEIYLKMEKVTVSDIQKIKPGTSMTWTLEGSKCLSAKQLAYECGFRKINPQVEKYKVSIDRKESKITITAIPVKKL